MTQQVGPLFQNYDPRLIVYGPKRPMILPLPKQTENATKVWIIFQLNKAMTIDNIEHKTNVSLKTTLSKKDRNILFRCKHQMSQK